MQYPSVALFVDRARAARADFDLTPENTQAVAELCERLDGLPLAIELAAARAAVLSPAEMLAHLEQRFAFLISRQRDMPSRHRTLRAAIEGSCQLLDPPLQQIFARLSVFRGGWTLEAAAAVCGEETAHGSPLTAHGSDQDRLSREPCTVSREPSSTLDALEQLRDCSLVQAQEGTEGTRYRLLETLREYAGEQLAASGELAAARKRQRDWCLQLALRVEAAASGPEEKQWLARLEAEIDNVRAALAWCLEEAEADLAPPGTHEVGDRRVPSGWAPGEGAAAALRLVEASWWLWYARGRPTEGLHWLEGALARGSHLSPAARALALVRASHLCSARGDRDRSRSYLQAARREYEAQLVVVRREENPAAVAEAVLCLSEVAFDLDDLDAAWEFGLEARQLFEALREPGQIATAVHWMAMVALRRQDRPTARALLEERIAIGRKLCNATLLIHALGAMGHLERDAGNYARAGALYRESLLLRQQLGHQIALAQSLEDFAVLTGREQQFERAIRILGAGERFCETLGARPPVAVASEYERTVEEGRTALGEAAFAAAWAEGRAMSLEEAVAYAVSSP